MGAAHLAVWIAARTPADLGPLVPVAMTADTPPGVEKLAQYGLLGILCAALLWFAFKAYQREVQRGDQAAAEVARLNAVIQEQALPAVLAATEVVKDYTDLLRDQRHAPRLDHHRNGVWREERAPSMGRGDGDQR